MIICQNSLRGIPTDKTNHQWNYILFFLLVICYIHQCKYQQNKVDKFFWCTFVIINPSVKLLPMDSSTDHKALTKVFFIEYCCL
jgi:hypothetical protein